MEKKEFTLLIKGLVSFLEQKNLITILSSESSLTEEINNLFINAEKYDEEHR